MHIYSSILDPCEPPRPARIYDNPQVVQRRSLLSQLFAGFRRAAVTPLTVSTAGRPGAGANRRAHTVERRDLAGQEGRPLCDHPRDLEEAFLSSPRLSAEVGVDLGSARTTRA